MYTYEDPTATSAPLNGLLPGMPRYEGPGNCGRTVERRRPGQLAAVFSMESGVYYGCQNDAVWLSQFNVTMVRSRP